MSEEVLKKILKELEGVESLEVRQVVFARLLEDYRNLPSVRKQMEADVCGATVIKRLKKYVREEEGRRK